MIHRDGAGKILLMGGGVTGQVVYQDGTPLQAEVIIIPVITPRVPES